MIEIIKRFIKFFIGGLFMGDDGGSGMSMSTIVKLIFIVISFIILFALLIIALTMRLGN